MKKLLSLLVCMSLLLSCCVIGFGTTASALEPSPEGDFFAFDGVIEDYVGAGGVIVIPAEIDGVPTTEIAADVFLNNTDITEVYLPEGLEKLGHRVFKGCTNLTKIELPYSLYEVGTECFNTCTGLTEVTIPGQLEKIAYNMFGSCDNLSKVNISYGVKEVHSNAFGGTIIQRFVFPETVEFIGGYAMNYLKLNTKFEIVICNPNLDLGKIVIAGGVFADYMEGKWRPDVIKRPWNSAFGDGTSVFEVTVPAGSAIAAFVNDWQNNGLLVAGEEGAASNTYEVVEKDASYFAGLAENQKDFGITQPRADLTFTSGSGGSAPGTTTPGTTTPGTTTPGTTTPGTTTPGTTTPGTTTPGTTTPGTTEPGTTEPGTTTPGSTDSGTNNTNKNNGGSITTVYEEENSLGTVLMIIGIVFGVLIIGVVVVAVIMLKKKAPAEEIAEEAEEEAAADETPAEDAE